MRSSPPPPPPPPLVAGMVHEENIWWIALFFFSFFHGARSKEKLNEMEEKTERVFFLELLENPTQGYHVTTGFSFFYCERVSEFVDRKKSAIGCSSCFLVGRKNYVIGFVRVRSVLVTPPCCSSCEHSFLLLFLSHHDDVRIF